MAHSISEEHLRLALDAARMGTWEWDPATGEVIWSDRVSTLFGLEPGDFDGTFESYLALIHPADRAHVKQAIGAALEADTDYEVEHRVQMPDGTTRWIRCIGQVHFDDAGQPVRMLGVTTDITERKQAEEALRESKAQYELIFQNSPLGIFNFDTEGIVTQCNAHFVDIIGASEDAVLGFNMLERIQDAEMRQAICDTLHEGEGYYEGEYRSITGDKSTSVRVLLNSITADDGTIIGGVGLVEDISEQKQVEQALRQSEERYRVLFEENPSMYFTVDVDGTVRSVNTFGANYLGYTVDELIGSSVLNVFHPDDRQAARDHLAKCLKHPSSVHQWELRKVHNDGHILWVEEYARALRHDDGQLSCLIVCQDITERKQAEKALRRSEETYRGLIDNATDAIYIQDREGRFLDVNQGAIDMYGYERDFFIGKTPKALSAPGKNNLEALAERLPQAFDGEPQRFEFWGRRKNGEIFPKEVRLHKGTYFDQDVVVAFAQDITERKEYEQKLIAAKEEAEEMNRVKSAFLANMSHELRTPLTSIIGFADVLEEEISGTNAELARLIERSGTRLLATLNSVLDLSMLESGTFSPSRRRLDLTAEVREKVALLRPLAADRALALHADLPEETIYATLDPSCLDRILNNLISNAIKFTEEGEVRVELDHDADHVHIRVHDTGIGIAEDFMPRLFDEFKQESEGIQRSYEGSGLGLAITQRLVHLMDGTISVDSQPGTGSTFTVTFNHASSIETVPSPKA